MKILTILITSALITLSATVSANNDTESTTKKLNDVLVATFKSSPDSVAESLIPGLYRVMLAFPRAGIGSSSYNKKVNVWCAENQQDAMTKAKMRQPVEAKKCDNPVKQQYELGQAMGVNGTPALLTESGQLIPGYVPADRLAAMLDEDKASTVLSQ